MNGTVFHLLAAHVQKSTEHLGRCVLISAGPEDSSRVINDEQCERTTDYLFWKTLKPNKPDCEKIPRVNSPLPKPSTMKDKQAYALCISLSPHCSLGAAEDSWKLCEKTK